MCRMVRLFVSIALFYRASCKGFYKEVLARQPLNISLSILNKPDDIRGNIWYNVGDDDIFMSLHQIILIGNQANKNIRLIMGSKKISI